MGKSSDRLDSSLIQGLADVGSLVVMLAVWFGFAWLYLHFFTWLGPVPFYIALIPITILGALAQDGTRKLPAVCSRRR